MGVWDGDWSAWEARKSAVHLASRTPVASPPAGQGLTGQRDGAAGGMPRFLEVPHGSNCRPAKPTFASVGTGGARGLCGAWSVCAESLEPTLFRRASSHPKLTKEQPCWDCPTRVLLGGAAQPGQARPSLSSGRDRKEPVFIVCGHTMGCAQAGAFPSASVNICQPPFQPGAE